ncbi:MAG: hypothetical protein NTX22_05760 [Ignavibacteriales bacterium]|nr:hypothetical protein [Ignavibacteriales bacterium]
MRFSKKNILAFFTFFLLSVHCFAQDMNWNATLVVNAYPSPFFNDWERDPSIGNLVIITSAGTPRTVFYARLKIIYPAIGGKVIIEGKSDTLSIPAGPQTQINTYNDIVDWKDVDYDKTLYETIARSGRLLEGDYIISVSLYRYNDNSLLTEASANFYTVYPDPPQLLDPVNEAQLSSSNSTPTFMWSPISTPTNYTIHYNLKIVERFPRQLAETALLSNPPHHVADIVGIGTYTYPTDALALENGKEYVWQITATNDNGFAPGTNNGKSEIWTFFYGTSQQKAFETLALETLILEENFAYLKNLNSLEITESDFSFSLNGTTNLELRFPNSDPRIISVIVDNLTFLKGNYTPPTFLSGRITAMLQQDDIPASITGQYFLPRELEFIAPNIFSISGALNFPNCNVPLNGKLTLSNGQLSGDLTAFGSSAVPICTLGEGNFLLKITEANIHFSDPVIKLMGELNLFGEQVNCQIPEMTLSRDGNLSAQVNCNINLVYPLVQGSEVLTLNFNNVAGSIRANLGNNTSDYNLNLTGGFDLKVGNLGGFGADIVYNLQPSGMDLVSFRPRGNVGIIPIDLGWLKINLENLSLASLSKSSGGWDFQFNFDVGFTFPSLNFTIPSSSGGSFNPGGFNIPAITLPNLSLPKITLGSFEIELNALRLLPSTINWPDLGSGNSGNLGFNFDLDLRMPNLSGGSGDLLNLVIPVLNASISNGNFSIPFPDLSFPLPGLELDLNGSFPFFITGLKGGLNISLSGGLNINPNILLKGRFSLPPAFACQGTNSYLELLTPSINLSSNGKVTGIVENIIPNCPLEIGLLKLTITSSKLILSLDGNTQQAFLEGSGNITLNSPGGQSITALATFKYDLMNQRLISFLAQVNQPFTINLPPQDPVLSFLINSATITQDEFIIDGRHQIRLSDRTTVGATFNEFKMRWQDYGVNSGTVIFDIPFALKATLENNQVDFKMVAAGSSLIDPVGILINLPSAVSIDRTGLKISGNASAYLKYDGRDLPNLNASFSQNFAISLNPFRIINGQCQILYGQTSIAIINANGFFPDLSSLTLALLPERLPLPIESIAYLQIKNGNDLLVEQSVENGNFRLRTKVGQPVKLVIKALQFDKPEPPEINVTFNILIDQVTKELVEGSINVQVPDNLLSTFDLRQFNIPFAIRNIFFGDVNGVKAFNFTGDLYSFGSVIKNQFQLSLLPNGKLFGEVNLDNLNKNFSLDQANKIIINLTQFSGSFNIQLVPANVQYDFTLDGSLRMNLGDVNYGAVIKLGLTQNGIELKQITADNLPLPPQIDLSWLSLTLSDFTIRSLTYSNNPGWDFELNMGIQIKIKDLNITTPIITGVKITKAGIIFPETSFPNIQDEVHALLGFGIKPTAFRMPSFTFNWFSQNPVPNNWGFKFDFQISFPGITDLRNISLAITNANIISGKIQGSITARTFNSNFPRLSFNPSFYYLIKELSGSLDLAANGTQTFDIKIKGDLQLPGSLQCQGETGLMNLTSTQLTIDANGIITGTIGSFVPRCPINLGIGSLTVVSSSLIFSKNINAQSIDLNLSGDLKLPSITDGQFATTRGNITFDLINGVIKDGQIAVNNSIRFGFPQNNPILLFEITSALLNKDGFKLISGNLKLPNSTVNATFDNLLFDFTNMAIKSGKVTLTNQFAFKVTASGGVFNWQTIAADQEVNDNSVIRLVLPNNIFLDKDGLHINSGTSNLFAKWNGNVFANITCTYNNLLVGFSSFIVKSGTAQIKSGSTNAATIDNVSPYLHLDPNFFDFVIPEKIPLPSETIAYLKIKNGNNLLIQTERKDNGLRIYTSSPVKLYMPGLKYSAANVPEEDVSFDFIVNTTTWALVSGSLDVTLTPPLQLKNYGVPVTIKKINYSLVSGVAVLRATGELWLPNALSSVAVKIENMTISSSGISGLVRVGNFKETFDPTGGYIKNAILGSIANFKLQAIEATFNPGSTTFKICGDITTGVFRNNRDSSAIHFTAQFTNNNYAFAFSLNHLQQPGKLDLNIAKFQVAQGYPKFTYTENDFSFELNGILSFPTLNNIAITITDLKFNKNGFVSPDISISRETEYQVFKIFNANFTLKDRGANKAITLAYTNSIFYATLNGSINFLDKNVDFQNFKIGTDGSISVQGVFVNQQIDIITGYLTITSLGITSQPVLKLTVNGNVKLPKPASSLTNNFTFGISADGTIDGSTVVTLLNQNQRLDNNPSVDNSEYQFWIATVDPTIIKLNLDFANIRNSSIQAVMDVYFSNSQSKRLSVGTGNPFAPGLEIKFDGSISWKNISVSQGLSDFNWDVFKLKNLIIAGSNNQNFALSISGKMELSLGEGGNNISGSLDFQGLNIDADGRVGSLSDVIRGGSLSVLNTVTVTLTSLEWEGGLDRTLTLKGGTLPSGNSNATSNNKQIQHVESYFSFGGEISIANVLSGGIDKFVAYKTRSGGNGFYIQNANLSIPNVLTFSADMDYQNISNRFLLLASGSGSFGNKTITVVGKVGKDGQNQSTFGLFVAVEGLEIPIGPLIINGIGGGFFYNPEQSDIILVQQKAQVDASVNSKITRSPGKFAVFLFGAAVIVSDNLVQGRVLITITQEYFSVDGKLIILNQGERIKGIAHLAVGFSNGFAEGNIDITLDIYSLVKGSGSLDFYYYGGDSWGITGRLSIDILSILHSQSDLYFGSEGFLCSISLNAGFDIWIIEVNAGFSGEIWYQTRNSSWGLFCTTWIDVEVLGGLASAEGRLQGALFGNANNFYIYGVASLSVSVCGIDWDGSVWGKISSSGCDGGFGGNSDLRKLIAEAKSASQEMENKRREAQQEIDNSMLANMQLTEQELSAVFDRLYSYGQMLKNVRTLGDLDSPEIRDAIWFINSTVDIEEEFGPYMDGEINQYVWVRDKVWLSQDLRESYSTAQLKAERIVLSHNISDFNTARTQVSTGLNQVIANPDIREMTRDEYAFGGNPVQNPNFDPPVTSTQVIGGKVCKVVRSGPGFSVDQTIAAANQTVASNAQTAMDQYETNLNSRINAINSSLRIVDNALEINGPIQANNSIGTKYSTLLSNMEGFYSHLNSRLYNEKTWANNTKTALSNNHRAALQGYIERKTNAVDNNELFNITEWRLRRLVELGDNPTDAQNKLNDFNRTWQNASANVKKQLCNQYGMDLWYNTNITGLQSFTNKSQDQMSDNERALQVELENINNGQTAYTDALDQLFAIRVQMHENLYDIYNSYYSWKNNQPDAIRNRPTTLQNINTYKNNIAALLVVPKITSFNVNLENFYYETIAKFSWTVNPVALENSMRLLNATNNQLLNDGFQSLGNSTSRWRYLLRPDNLSAGNYTMFLKARSGAGFTSSRMVQFSVTYATQGDYTTESTVQMQGDQTAPSNPVITLPRLYKNAQNLLIASEQKIYANWISTDDQSDIVEYQYKVTFPNGTAMIDWTSAGGRTDLEILGLTMHTGNRYRLYVKSKNGVGLWSATNIFKEFLYDGTGPTRPTVRNIAPPVINPLVDGANPQVIPPVDLPQELMSNDIENPVPEIHLPHIYRGAVPTLTVYWNASNDPESGLSYYEYRVVTKNEPVRKTDWDSLGNVLQKTISGGFLNFIDSFYVEICAVNKVGIRSEILSIGPVRPLDTTFPTKPVAAVSYRRSIQRVYLIFSELSEDLDSKIKGYQVAIGTTAGGTNKKNWNNSVDFTPDDMGPASSWLTPNFNLPNGRYFMSIRAKNNQNMASYRCVTAPFYVDDTPPVTPDIRVNFNVIPPINLPPTPGRTEIIFRFNDVSDPESSIKYLEYAIGTSSNNTAISGWTDVDPSTQSVTENITKFNLERGIRFYARVRTTNNLGLSSVSYKIFQIP